VGDNVIVGDACLIRDGLNAVGVAHLFNGKTGALLRMFQRPARVAFAQFGIAVASVGSEVLIGANGSAMVYVYDAATRCLVRTIANPRPSETASSFGFALATSGSHVVVAAPGTRVAHMEGAGTVYLFNATTGNLIRTFLNPRPGEFDAFGWAVAARGVLGTDFYVLVGSSSGDVFLFKGNGTLRHTFVNPVGSIQDRSGVAFVGKNALIGAAKVYFYDSDSGALLHTFQPPNQHVDWFRRRCGGRGF
jgi:DNA-binding beta-propeller fold protein YncE